MKTIKGWLAALLLGSIFLPGAVLAQVQIGISAGGPAGSFYLAIGDYFKVPQTQVTVIRQHRIPDEQVPVVLFIANKGHVTQEQVLELRAEGFSWMETALRCGVGPEAFYIESKNTRGPYNGLYAKYSKYSRKQWRKIRLSDDDIVNFVNLRFMSEKYNRSPDEVVDLRAQGRNFVQINDNWRTPPQAADHGKVRHDNRGDRGRTKRR